MKTDLYTKAVLTVIAISLSAIAVQHTIPNAFAQQNTQPIKVMICDPNPNWYNSYGYNSSSGDQYHCAKVDGQSVKVRTD